MSDKKHLTIVSFFGENALNSAIETITRIEPTSIVNRLHEGTVVYIEHSIPDNVLTEVFEQFDKHKLDYSTIKPAPKKLLIADMDSTIISCECLDELSDFAGKKAEVSAITERAMRGELNFEEALKARVGMLAGLSVNALNDCFDERVALNQGAVEMVRGLKDMGAYTSLVSGGFKFFTSRVKEMVGFDEDNSNEFVYSADVLSLTGEVVEPILGKEAKLARLEYLCKEKNIAYEDVVAIGDGANDLMMIEKAGLGVAYMAKPIVAAKAPARINSGNLLSVLYFCGVK